MADNDNIVATMLELERRGALPAEDAAVLGELRRRGAVPAPQGGAQPSAPAGPSYRQQLLTGTAPGQVGPGYSPSGYSPNNPAVGGAILHGLARAPRAFAEGAGALATEAVAAIEGLPGGAGKVAAEMGRDRYYNAVDLARSEAEANNPGSTLVGDIAAGVVPLSPGRLATGSNTLKGALGRSIGAGVVGSQVAYQHPEDRMTTAALGAAIPAIATTISKAGGAVMNSVARTVGRRQDQASQALRAQAREAFTDPTTGAPLQGVDDYIPAQATGDPRLARLTASASDIRARDYIRGQLNQRIENVRKVADSMGGMKAITSDESKAAAFYKVVNDHDRDLRAARNLRYKTDLAALTSSPEGAAVRVPVQPIVDELKAIQSEFGNPLALAKNIPGGTRIAEALETLDSLPPGSKLNIVGLQKLISGINAGRIYGQAVNADPAVGAMNAIRSRLQEATKAAVDALPDNAPGAKQLKAIQAQYAADSDQVRRLEDDTLTGLFGDKGVLADPDSAFDKFLKATPTAQRLGADILSARNPEALGYLRQRYLDKVLDDATGGATQATKSTLDPKKLFDGLTSENLRKSPLFTADQKRWAAASAADLKVILNSLPDTARIGTDITPADLSINALSANPAFLSRLFARALTGLQFENVLFTPAGHSAVTTMRNLSTASDQAKVATATYLMSLVAATERGAPTPAAESQNPPR